MMFRVVVVHGNLPGMKHQILYCFLAFVLNFVFSCAGFLILIFNSQSSHLSLASGPDSYSTLLWTDPPIPLRPLPLTVPQSTHSLRVASDSQATTSRNILASLQRHLLPLSQLYHLALPSTKNQILIQSTCSKN